MYTNTNRVIQSNCSLPEERALHKGIILHGSHRLIMWCGGEYTSWSTPELCLHDGRREMERVLSVPCRETVKMNQETSDIWWPCRVCWGWRVREGQVVFAGGVSVCNKKQRGCTHSVWAGTYAFMEHTQCTVLYGGLCICVTCRFSRVWGCNQIADRMSITGAWRVTEVPLWQSEGWLWPSEVTTLQGSTIKPLFCIFPTLSLLSYNQPNSTAFTTQTLMSPDDCIASCKNWKWGCMWNWTEVQW